MNQVEREGRAAAGAYRERHGLGVQPLGDLVTLIDQIHEIDVAVLPDGPDAHGLTMWDPHRDVALIAAACTENAMRQRSTLAHELGHLEFQDGEPPKADGWAERSPQERRADTFARHLLAPLEGIRLVLGEPGGEVSEAILSEMVRRFLISPSMMAIQLECGGYIGATRKRLWLTSTTPDLAARFGWTDQYRALQAESLARRPPRRLLTRATRAYERNLLSVEAIARLRGTTPWEASKDLSEAGIRPSTQPVAWSSPGDLPEADVDLSDLDDEGRSASASDESAG